MRYGDDIQSANRELPTAFAEACSDCVTFLRGADE
ncbi:hypothetical protein NPIL_461521, partial [Nephila pilipes]